MIWFCQAHLHFPIRVSRWSRALKVWLLTQKLCCFCHATVCSIKIKEIKKLTLSYLQYTFYSRVSPWYFLQKLHEVVKTLGKADCPPTPEPILIERTNIPSGKKLGFCLNWGPLRSRSQDRISKQKNCTV